MVYKSQFSLHLPGRHIGLRKLTYLLQHILNLAVLEREPRVQERPEIVAIVVWSVRLQIPVVGVSVGVNFIKQQI